MESTPCAIVIFNKNREIVLANAMSEQMFGYASQELLGQSVDILFPPRFRYIFAEIIRNSTEVPYVPESENYHGLRKNGNELPVEIDLSLISIAEEKLMLASIVDLTERKKNGTGNQQTA